MTTAISNSRPKQDWGTDEMAIADARPQVTPRESRAASTEQTQCITPGAAELASRHKPSASARAAAAHMAASRKDCAVEGATVVGTCSAGLVAAGAGLATGPGEIFIVGAAGFACGLAYINYADCLEENTP